MIVDLETAVWKGDRIEEKERIAGILIDPLEDVLLDQFLSVDSFLSAGVFRNRNAMVVVIEIGGKVTVGVALAVVAEEMVDAVPERASGGVEHAHPPLAHGCGPVSSCLEDLPDRHGVLRKRALSFWLDFTIRPGWTIPHVEAGEEGSARRSANTGARVSRQISRALAAKSVKVRSLN